MQQQPQQQCKALAIMMPGQAASHCQMKQQHHHQKQQQLEPMVQHWPATSVPSLGQTCTWVLLQLQHEQLRPSGAIAHRLGALCCTHSFQCADMALHDFSYMLACVYMQTLSLAARGHVTTQPGHQSFLCNMDSR
jgi:hypothetical protein